MPAFCLRNVLRRPDGTKTYWSCSQELMHCLLWCLSIPTHVRLCVRQAPAPSFDLPLMVLSSPRTCVPVCPAGTWTRRRWMRRRHWCGCCASGEMQRVGHRPAHGDGTLAVCLAAATWRLQQAAQRTSLRVVPRKDTPTATCVGHRHAATHRPVPPQRLASPWPILGTRCGRLYAYILPSHVVTSST